MNLRENMSINKLIEHPENKKLFKDIKETNPTFWAEFVDSIKQDGVIEPLIVNRETMQVRSGNQRLKAAIELGLETVPVLLIDETTTDDEIRKMISSNVFRRTIDPFAMFEYIGRLRKPASSSSPVVPQSQIKKKIHKNNEFMTASDIFNDLPKGQQEALEEWFNEKAEGEKAKSEGELIITIRNMKLNKTTLMEELSKAKTEQTELEDYYGQLKKEKEEVDAKIIDLEELRDIDSEEELEQRDMEINKLLKDKVKLKEKIKELKESPDINLYLIESVKKLLDINVTLRSIMQNQDALNPVKLQEFSDALKVTVAIIKGINKKELRSLS